MTAIFGIDLGTTYTKCALVWPQNNRLEVFDLDRHPEEPNRRVHGLRSAVTVTNHGDDFVAYVGHAAMKAISEVRPPNAPKMRYFEEAKLWIGDEEKGGGSDRPPWRFRAHNWEYSAGDVGAMVLKKVQQEVEGVRGTMVTRAVITHPQGFGDSRRVATIQAARLAGLEVEATLTEPNAALIAFHWAEEPTGRYMIFDLGGGTLDVTIADSSPTSFRVIGNGALKKGGRHVDRLIYGKMVQEYAHAYPAFEERYLDDRTRRAWYQHAEATKKALNEPNADPQIVTFECRTEDFPGGMDIRFSLSRAEFLDLTKDLINECVACGTKALEDAGIDWSDLSEIVCVGGSTRLNQLQSALAETSGRPINTSIDPDTAVVQGAARFAHLRAQRHASIQRRPGDSASPISSSPSGSPTARAESIAMQFALPNALGILAWSTREQADIVVPLVKKNAVLPYEKRFENKFRTAEDGATEIAVELYEGDRPEPRRCIRLGAATLAGIPAGPAGPVIVTLKIDEDQTKHLIVEAGGMRTEAVIKYDPGRVMPDDELEWRQRHLSRVEIMPSEVDG